MEVQDLKKQMHCFIYQPDIDKIYSYVKDPYGARCQLQINKREYAGIKHFNNSEAFIENSNDTNDIYKNIEEYNLNKKRKILIVFDGTVAYINNSSNIDFKEFINLYKKYSSKQHSFLFIDTTLASDNPLLF